MPSTTHLLYLHGFRSSPNSAKARKMADIVQNLRPGVKVVERPKENKEPGNAGKPDAAPAANPAAPGTPNAAPTAAPAAPAPAK